MKPKINLIIRLFIFFALAGLTLEIVFRTVVPTCDRMFTSFDETNKLTLYRSDKPRTGRRITGNLAQINAHWRVNNDGWLSEADYFPRGQRGRPLIAIFGDSHVEALQVDEDKSLSRKLYEELKGNWDVYRFSNSGWSLSQYLHVSRYASKKYDPYVIVFLVGGEDIEESFGDNCLPTNMHLQKCEGRWEEVAPRYVPPSPAGQMALQSALIRYITLNRGINIVDAFRQVIHHWVGSKRNTLDTTDWRTVAENLIEKASRENVQRKFLVVLKPGARNPSGDRDAQREYRTAAIIKEVAPKYGVPVLDLNQVFGRKWTSLDPPYHFPNDSHFTEIGHTVAAKAVASFLNENNLLLRAEEYFTPLAIRPVGSDK